jgi:hypothetical protein
MKKLLFVVAACAFVTLSTTSCSKSCESCTVETKALGQTITTDKLTTKAECDAAKAKSGVVLGSGVEVTCN